MAKDMVTKPMKAIAEILATPPDLLLLFGITPEADECKKTGIDGECADAWPDRCCRRKVSCSCNQNLAAGGDGFLGFSFIAEIRCVVASACDSVHGICQVLSVRCLSQMRLMLSAGSICVMDKEAPHTQRFAPHTILVLHMLCNALVPLQVLTYLQAPGVHEGGQYVQTGCDHQIHGQRIA